MDQVLLGNIVCGAGAVVMVLIGLIKKKKAILLAQCLQFLLMAAGNFILGGISGTVSNGVSIARNIVCMYTAYTTPLKGLFVGIQFVLTLIWNEGGILGWLPFIAAGTFTLCLGSKREIFIKEVIIFCQILWTIYDFFLMNYLTMALDLFTIVTTVIGIIRITRDRKAESAGI